MRFSSAVPAIFCDVCKKWLHLKCSNVTVSQFAGLSSSSTPYFCHMCISDSLPVNLDCDYSISDIAYNPCHYFLTQVTPSVNIV